MILALAGGVGGARLARGLAGILAPGSLRVAVNTGDDFEHLGLHISPDIDTVIYTLAGLHDEVRGWGMAGETWQFMSAIKALGGEDWFSLGDQDIATHVLRTQWLHEGRTLSAVTQELARRRGLATQVFPMSDDPVRSMVASDAGELTFQDYFVRHRCEPRFRALRLDKVEAARPAEAFAAAMSAPDLEAIVICPSNPILSIAPILAVPGIRDLLEARKVPAVAVSPFIGGKAIKGPAAKILRELGLEPTPRAVADAYKGVIDGLIIDESDIGLPRADGIAHHVTDTLMKGDAGQQRVARETLDFAAKLAGGAQG